MNRLLLVLKIIIILLIFCAIGYRVFTHNAERPKVLVVHSYYKDLAWVNEINEGLARALAANNAPTLNVRTHYMNLKNHPDCNYFKNSASDVRFTIDDWKPDAVILVDDLAQMLVGFNQLNVSDNFDRVSYVEDINLAISGSNCDPKPLSYFGLDKPQTEKFPEIIFAGVNGTVKDYGYHFASNVSGIHENKNYQALLDILTTLSDAGDSHATSIHMLNDASGTAKIENENFTNESWSPFSNNQALSVGTFDLWKQAVVTANTNNAMLLIANYQGVVNANNERIPATELIAWTEQNARLPVLGANTNFVADGGMMTVAISGTEQGQVAMELAIKRLAGNSEADFRKAKQFVIGMNQSLVRKRNLKLPEIYEAFSREVDQFVDVVDHLYMEQGASQ